MPQIPILNIPELFVTGNTWTGFSCKITENGKPVKLTDAKITATLKISNNPNLQNNYSVIFSTDPAQDQYLIIISDPLRGLFEFSKIKSFVGEPGVYLGPVEITYPDGDKFTYFTMQITVVKNV